MAIEIGRIEAIFRYPVKSMRGEALDTATLGWHGIEGDRRLAFRRLDDPGGFPWLSATKLPQLILFTPQPGEDGNRDELPSRVLTPEGAALPLFGDSLAADVGRRCRIPVQMMHLRNGMFDEASISVITSGTVREVCRLAELNPDVRRFRPNIVVHSALEGGFDEDAWLGGTLAFGETGSAPTIGVTQRDIRCAMMNFDPDDASTAPDVLKTVVRVHDNTAGIYATVTRTGRLEVGQAVFLHR